MYKNKFHLSYQYILMKIVKHFDNLKKKKKKKKKSKLLYIYITKNKIKL